MLVGCPGFCGGLPVCRSAERRGFGLLRWERSKKEIKAPLALGCSQGPPRGGCKVFLNPVCASEKYASISSSDRQKVVPQDTLMAKSNINLKIKWAFKIYL